MLGRAHGLVDDARRLQDHASSAGALQIGKGRLYVDGLLAENHGAARPIRPSALFDAAARRAAFADPIAYAAQPYLPNPPALPTAGRHLVYLDVWEREVTHLEQPDLVEIAVGVDTSSRLQTVWQVRVLADDAGSGTTCASPDADMPGWAALIAPSTGRLTTGTFDVRAGRRPVRAAADRRLSRAREPALPRRDPRPRPARRHGATFKWSRENASVGSRVASMVSATELELADARPRRRAALQHRRLGRDHRRRARVLAGAAARCGKITVDEATRRITFTPALPADDAAGELSRQRLSRRTATCACAAGTRAGKSSAPAPAARRSRSRISTPPGSTGVIAVPAAGTTLLLENGVTVSFASTGAKGFRAGDYWVFAARTADASVELLDRAPPRGIHHHYARLGIWDVGGRHRHRLPPPLAAARPAAHDCSCTACVTAGVARQRRSSRSRTRSTRCARPAARSASAPASIALARAGAADRRAIAAHPRAGRRRRVIVAPGGAFAIAQLRSPSRIENLAILSLGRQLGDQRRARRSAWRCASC